VLLFVQADDLDDTRESGDGEHPGFAVQAGPAGFVPSFLDGHRLPVCQRDDTNRNRDNGHRRKNT
jgi:hypothetical protein